jgi:hypothetical protein
MVRLALGTRLRILRLARGIDRSPAALRLLGFSRAPAPILRPTPDSSDPEPSEWSCDHMVLRPEPCGQTTFRRDRKSFRTYDPRKRSRLPRGNRAHLRPRAHDLTIAHPSKRPGEPCDSGHFGRSTPTLASRRDSGAKHALALRPNRTSGNTTPDLATGRRTGRIRQTLRLQRIRGQSRHDLAIVQDSD